MFESQRSQRFNPTDATLWAIKRDPELRTTIVGLALLDREPEWAIFVSSIQRTVDNIPRLRQRVAEPPLGIGRPRWVDTEPDLDFHLQRVSLSGSPDRRRLFDLAGTLAAQDFDENRPLWQMHLVQDMADGGAALLVKISHSLTDGIEGMGLLRAIGDDVEVDTGHRKSVAGPNRKSRTSSGPTKAGPRLAGEVMTASARAGRHPLRTIESTVKLTGSASRMLAPAGQPLSPLMTKRGPHRWAGVTDLPLERLRRAAHRAGGTINDAFVTIALSAVADYHGELGSDGARFRVTLPVNLRPANRSAAAAGSSNTEAAGTGGNQWAPARLVLEVDRQAHPFAELHRHQNVLRSAIREPAIPFTQLLAAGILELPPAITTSIVGGMVKGSDVAISDVPGLTEPLTVAGSDVTHFYPFAPTGGAALNITLVSHVGNACIGFTIDTEAISEPERLVRCFEERAADFLRRRKAPKTPQPDKPATGPAHEAAAEAQSGGGHQPGIERLSALDTSFLRMETTTTPMHMGGLFVIEGQGFLDSDNQLDIDGMRRYVKARLDRMPRLSRKVREVPLELGRPVWIDHPGLDIAEHVHHRTLPQPGSRAQLFELCQELQMQLLDRRRPLFELTFIDGLDPSEFGPNTIALVERVHHALLDGMSGIEMVALLFDTEPAPERSADRESGGDPSDGRPRPMRDETPSSLRLMVDAAADRAGDPLHLARGTARAITRPKKTAADLGRVIGTVADLLRPGQLSTGPLDHPVGNRRHLGSTSVPLATVKDAGSRLDASVNDIVLTAVAHGVRTLLESRAEPLPDSFVVLVPVSSRNLGMAEEQGNHVAALTVELPIQDRSLRSMLATVSHRMDRLKADHHAEGSEILLDAADHLPPRAVDLVARLIGHQRSVDMVVTNLPGPPTPLFLGRNRVREMIPILPLGGNLTIGVAVLSYDGNLIVAFNDGDDDHDDLAVIVEATRDALMTLAAPADGDASNPARAEAQTDL